MPHLKSFATESTRGTLSSSQAGAHHFLLCLTTRYPHHRHTSEGPQAHIRKTTCLPGLRWEAAALIKPGASTQPSGSSSRNFSPTALTEKSPVVFVFLCVYMCDSVTFLTVIKCHDHGNLQTAELIWADDSRGLGSMMVEQRHGSKGLNHQKAHKSKD